VELAEAARYCPQCGTATGTESFTSGSGHPTRVLRRPREDRKLAGVCSGIARYLGVDVTLVRVLTVVLALWPPCLGLIVYLVCWIVMPQDPLLLAPPAPSSTGTDAGNLATM
jgi:phage shock protein C